MCVRDGQWKEGVQRTNSKSGLVSLTSVLTVYLALAREMSETVSWFFSVSLLSGNWACSLFSLLLSKAHFVDEEPSQGRAELAPEPGHHRYLQCRTFLQPSGLQLRGLFVMSEHFHHLGCVCVCVCVSVSPAYHHSYDSFPEILPWFPQMGWNICSLWFIILRNRLHVIKEWERRSFRVREHEWQTAIISYSSSSSF